MAAEEVIPDWIAKAGAATVDADVIEETDPA